MAVVSSLSLGARGADRGGDGSGRRSDRGPHRIPPGVVGIENRTRRGGDMRRRWFWSASGVLVAAMAVGGYRAAEAYRFRASLGRARQEFGQGRYDVAKTRLVQLSARRPGEGEVEYLLGLSEKAVGNTDAALAAWARIPAGSPFAPRASFERGVLAMERGKYTLAEQFFGAGLPEPRGPAPQGRLPLVALFSLPGGKHQAPRVVPGAW